MESSTRGERVTVAELNNLFSGDTVRQKVQITAVPMFMLQLGQIDVTGK